MPSLIQNLIERAQAIGDAMEGKRADLERQYAEKKTELAALEAEIAQIGKVPHRREFLFVAYRDGKGLCPRCSLERGVEIEMINMEGGTDTYDVFRCPFCGLEDQGEF